MTDLAQMQQAMARLLGWRAEKRFDDDYPFVLLRPDGTEGE